MSYFLLNTLFSSFQFSISVTAIGPGPMDTPFFYGQETAQFLDRRKTEYP